MDVGEDEGEVVDECDWEGDGGDVGGDWEVYVLVGECWEGLRIFLDLFRIVEFDYYVYFCIDIFFFLFIILLFDGLYVGYGFEKFNSL